MKVVIQRVSQASVTIDNQVPGSISRGFLLLVGVSDKDNEEVINKVAQKIYNLRIFEDEQGKMNKSLADVQGQILSISQFTLFADCKKGNRPSFTDAGKPEHAKEMYELFNKKLQSMNVNVQEGVFGADMKVSLLNDGPVTIIMDSDKI